MKQTSRLQAKQTILVVDQDEQALKFISESLAEDYAVLTAKSGEDALRQSQKCKSEISFLLADLQMDTMTGIDLATQITVHRPTLKVFLIAHYPAGLLVLNGGWHFLPNPLIASQLLTLVASGKSSRVAA